MPQTRPLRHASPLDDLLESRPQIDRSPVAALSGFVLQAGQNVVDSGIEHVFEVRTQLGEDGHDASLFADVMLGLRGVNLHPALFPIHVRPTKRQGFRRSPQPSES